MVVEKRPATSNPSAAHVGKKQKAATVDVPAVSHATSASVKIKSQRSLARKSKPRQHFSREAGKEFGVVASNENGATRPITKAILKSYTSQTRSGKWCLQIYLNKKNNYVGTYDTEEQADMAGQAIKDNISPDVNGDILSSQQIANVIQRAKTIAEEALEDLKAGNHPLHHKLTKFDVVCGRGKGIREFPGNQFFRGLGDKHFPQFKNASQEKGKNQIVSKIIQQVKSKGGFFVKLPPSSEAKVGQPCIIISEETFYESKTRSMLYDRAKRARASKDSSVSEISDLDTCQAFVDKRGKVGQTKTCNQSNGFEMSEDETETEDSDDEACSSHRKLTKPRAKPTDHLLLEHQEFENTPYIRQHSPRQANIHLAATELEHYRKHEEEEKKLSRLVFDQDRELHTDFSFFLWKQFHLLESGGLQCLNCVRAGSPHPYKFYPKSAKELDSNLACMRKHSLECPSCPQDIKESLRVLESDHENQKSGLPPGSRKTAIEIIWDRIENETTDDSVATSPSRPAKDLAASLARRTKERRASSEGSASKKGAVNEKLGAKNPAVQNQNTFDRKVENKPSQKPFRERLEKLQSVKLHLTEEVYSKKQQELLETIFTPSEKPIREMLEQLQTVKDLLADEEYTKKKQGILDRICTPSEKGIGEMLKQLQTIKDLLAEEGLEEYTEWEQEIVDLFI